MKYNSNDIIHEKKGDIEYLKFKILEKYSDKINHMITLRHGGVSSGDVSSLNFRTLGKDDKNNNIKNLELVCNILDIDPQNIHKGKQAHTDNVLIIDSANKEKYRFDVFSQDEYDAYVTNEKNIATLVTTADCNPIIIYDPIKNILANVHSGWKGTIKKVYIEAIDVMVEKFNSKVEDLIFCIGPSIKKCCFTSKEEEFKEKFLNTWKYEKEYIFYDDDNETFHIDLTYVIKKDILEKGIKEENIAICDICTMCNSNDFYSYRKSLHENYSDYGTFATIAYIK